MNNVFEKYLSYRFQRDGAVTPGQKLEVLRSVRADAERGRKQDGDGDGGVEPEPVLRIAERSGQLGHIVDRREGGRRLVRNRFPGRHRTTTC